MTPSPSLPLRDADLRDPIMDMETDDSNTLSALGSGGMFHIQTYKAIETAIGEGNEERACEVLAASGAHPNDPEMQDDFTMLQYAIHFGKVEVFEFLLRQGGTLEAKHYRSGHTAWHVAVLNCDVEMMHRLELEKAGANMFARDDQGYNAMHMLASTMLSSYYDKLGELHAWREDIEPWLITTPHPDRPRR